MSKEYGRPKKADALRQLLAAIKMCRGAFSEDYPNFCAMLEAWLHRAEDMRRTLTGGGKK